MALSLAGCRRRCAAVYPCRNFNVQNAYLERQDAFSRYRRMVVFVRDRVCQSLDQRLALPLLFVPEAFLFPGGVCTAALTPKYSHENIKRVHSGGG